MWTDTDLTAAATTLLAEITADDWGQVAVSYYDTGRLVALSPWLSGHDARVDFLCHQQRPDGGWGGPDGYALVPTLSATSALLTELGRTTSRGHRKRLARASMHGLTALRRLLRIQIPDTIGVELVVPALLEELHDVLAQVGQDPYLADLGTTTKDEITMPAGFDQQLLARIRARAGTGQLPQRAWACLEVTDDAAVAAPGVHHAAGAVGCSAAATAAWLGGASGDQEALTFLQTLQARGGGPVPGVTPITYFEPAWVLNSLALGELTPTVPPKLLDRLEAGLTPRGVPAAPGLPPDADDTAAALSALLRHQRVHSPDSLLEFRTDGYFKCFLDERNPSLSTNAHVLETLALYLAHQPDQHARYAPAADMTADWLLAQQQPDGSWWDKWHASPYYATACVVLALLIHDPAKARGAIDKAVDWVRDTQHRNGTWGRWEGTVEETAYAVQVLAKAATHDSAATSITLGCAFLADPPPIAEHAPLWHAKDLYTPVAVIQAARIGALACASTATGVPHQRRAVAAEVTADMR